MSIIDKYYERAQEYVENNDVEKAITTFIAGLDHGCVKCAFGVIHTLMSHRSYTMTEDEAISIFDSSYSDIKRLAEEGDTEAMVMVAEGIRYGFVEDDDEPYLFWLMKAAELGDKSAMSVMEELGMPYDPWELPGGLLFVTNEAKSMMDSTDALLLDDQFNLDDADDVNDIEGVLDDHALIDDADWVIREQYDINLRMKKRERLNELLKCTDNKAIEEINLGDVEI